MPKSYPPGLGHTPKRSETPKARAASTKRSATSPKRTPKSASTAKKSPQEVAAPPSRGLLPCMVYVVLYHASAAGALVYWHAHEHRVFNGWHVLLAVFCVINAWICICEIALLVCNVEIKRQHAEYASTLGPHVMPSVFLFDRVTVFELFTLRFWSLMWSQYAVLDPSYADTTTFGFCVDIGNGVTTLVPTVLFAIGMTFDILPARVLGMLGLVKFWQAQKTEPSGLGSRVRVQG